MLIEITYNVTDVFMSTTETPVYVEISFEQPGGTSAVWGSITGTLSDQTDLQNALNAKLDESTIDGGTEGQILSKASATDFDFAWINNYAKYLATNVRNQTGSTIGAFQVVYISGATGNKPLISLADADTEATSTKTYGVTATAIANNGTGDVVTAGELSGIDTSSFNEGDLLWLSTTAGGVVTSPPAEPAHAVFIGTVIRSHPTLGVIDVAIANGYELNELHGVQITTPTDNQGLFYNATSTLWENKTISTALGYTPVPTTRNITINGVTFDLSADRTWTISTGISGSGASGQVTYWTGASDVSGSTGLLYNDSTGVMTLSKNQNATTSLTITNTTSGTASNANLTITSNNGSLQLAKYSPLTTTYKILLGNDSYIYNNVSGDIAILNDFATGRIKFAAGAVSTSQMTLFANGNLAINSGVSDLGVRLGVVGDTLLRGSGNTSATTALTVQNSDTTNLFRITNNGIATFGSTGSTNISSAELSTGAVSTGALSRAILFSTENGNGIGYQFYFRNSITGGNTFQTSGAHGAIQINSGFAPTSGTAQFNTLLIANTINQTGGANGITRGLYVNPTLTAAADWRSIEWSNNTGWGLYGAGTANNLLNGRLYIPAGSYDLPSLSFSNDTNTGLFSPLVDNLELKTGTNNAVILENQGINLMQYSENLGTFPTNFQQVSVSIPGNVAAPDGTLTANIAVPDTSLNQHRFWRSMTLSQPHTVSVYAKSAGYNFISIAAGGGVQGETIIFDIANGTISGSAAQHTATIENVGNGWFRCSLTITTASGPTTLSRWIIVRNANSTASYSGDGTSGVYVWGWQMEENTASTSYTKTGATAVTRPQAISLLGQNLYGNLITRRVTGPSQTDLSFATSFTDRMTIHATSGNVMINSSSDLGQRLQVIGDTLLRGSGATSATTALTVQNSSGNTYLQVRNDGSVVATTNMAVGGVWGLSQYVAFQGRTLTLTGAAGGGGDFLINSFSLNSASVFNGSMSFNTFNNSFTHSNTGAYNSTIVSISPTINQTGGANGITRGLYVNPTLTSAADFRAIETTNGKIVFGNLPTSSAGLPTGALWNDAGTVKIV